jgi:hypothetical protein
MIINEGFFQPTGNTIAAAFNTTPATFTIAASNVVFDKVRVTNSGGLCFLLISSSDPGAAFAVPTPGGNNSKNVISIPGGQSFISTGLTTPGTTYISLISATGSGIIYFQPGSFL